VNVNAVLTLLHFLAPQIDRSIWVLWRIVQIDHLESTLISTDERCFNVSQLIFAFAIIKKLCQFIQDNQLDRFILVNDTLCIVNTV